MSISGNQNGCILTTFNKGDLTMELITFESESFYKLIDELVKRINNNQKVPEKWITEAKAMKLLNCKKTKLWSLRVAGSIRFSQHSRKIILYDSQSIMNYLEANAHDTF